MSLPLTELRAVVNGPVLEPSDDAFHDEVYGFDLNAQYHPDVAVGVTSEADVVEAVRFAAVHELPVSVQSTGHGAHDDLVGGMLILTKRLDGVSVDAAARTATIGGGAWWKPVIEQAAAHGLAPITGSSTTVGAVGYTLGGGLGPLARSHGFSSDYVRGFRVVTADAQVKVATETENADLFWALRGGKAGFGVVTEMTVALVPLDEVYGGSLFFDAEHIDTVLRGWLDWSATADDNVTTSAAIMRFPDFEQVPAPLRGKTAITLRFVYPGDAAEGEKLASPLRALAPAFIDGLGSMPAAKIGLVHNDPDQPGMSWVHGSMLTHVDSAFADRFLAHFGGDIQLPLIAAELRHLGHKTRVDVPEGSAVGGRSNAYTLSLVGALPPNFPASAYLAMLSDVSADLAEWLSPQTTINFAGHPTPKQFPHSWPTDTWARLQEVATSHDPEGLFTWR